jgi:2-polyprenyl-3-methyl-5-hydroxy-6-metoxy-1,4-benzoquinol methylase
MSFLKRVLDVVNTEPQGPATEQVSCLYCHSTDAVKYRNRADIVKCSACGLIYLRTRPTMAALYQIYQDYASTGHMKLPDNLAEAKQSPLRRTEFVNEVLSFATVKSGQWLDVGCGWAALLSNVREHGFTPLGIEVTRNCIDYATMQLQIPVSNNQLTDSRVGDNSCQVISMVHVFEHIPNPKETLSKIYNTLVPGGLFCGIVPNIESYCSDIQQENWVWLDETHHYTHYTPSTLKEKLEQGGFVVERIYTAVGDYEEYFYDILRKEFPNMNDAEVQQKKQELELNGKGDEIRFFARKK